MGVTSCSAPQHKKRGSREASSDQALDHHVTVLYFGGSPGLGRCRIPEALQILYGVCYQTNVSSRSGAVSCIVDVIDCQSRAAAEHVHWAIFINWLTLLRSSALTSRWCTSSHHETHFED